MKDRTQKYISSQRPEKSHLLPAQKDLSVHDTFCWFFCLFVWDFTVAGILNLFLFFFLGGCSLGEFFLMEASSKPYAPPQSTSLLSSLKKGKRKKRKKKKGQKKKKKEEKPTSPAVCPQVLPPEKLV